ncbi:MAG: hypothetical protein LBB48_01375 [Treponema sp.]|jgi:hypothetical protein|nr:hypothetical protein [Treponema sp.]
MNDWEGIVRFETVRVLVAGEIIRGVVREARDVAARPRPAKRGLTVVMEIRHHFQARGRRVRR